MDGYSLLTGARSGSIALFLHSLSGGGVQRRALTLADAFAAKGYRVDLVVVRPEGPLHSKIPHRIWLVPLQSWLRRLPIVRSVGRLQLWVNIPALAGYLRQERPDVLLAAASHVSRAAAAPATL